MTHYNLKWKRIKSIRKVLIYITVLLVFLIRLNIERKTQEDPTKLSYAQTAKDSLKNVNVTKEEEISYNLQLKRRCNIPDSIPWGHYKIFLYEKGVKAELARLDKSINEHRKLLKEKLR